MQAVRLGMERHNKERELVALLLGGVCPKPVHPQQLIAGLVLVLTHLKVSLVQPSPSGMLL